MLDIRPEPALHVGVTHDYRAPLRRELSGGDVVALNRHDDGSTALLIADLSAKGAEGAAYASYLAAVFQITSALIMRPSAILRQLNRILVHAFYDQAAGLFASAFVCRVLASSSVLIYSCAGAEPPLLVRNSALHATLHTDDHILGIDWHASYHDRAIPIAHNDVLIAYTDGITESRRHSTSTLLGTQGVLEALELSAFRSSVPNSEDVFSAIDQLNGGLYYDDATLLVASVQAA